MKDIILTREYGIWCEMDASHPLVVNADKIYVREQKGKTYVSSGVLERDGYQRLLTCPCCPIPEAWWHKGPEPTDVAALVQKALDPRVPALLVSDDHGQAAFVGLDYRSFNAGDSSWSDRVEEHNKRVPKGHRIPQDGGGIVLIEIDEEGTTRYRQRSLWQGTLEDDIDFERILELTKGIIPL